MIKLKNLFKYYDNKFQRTFVLKDVDITINKGEFVSIMELLKQLNDEGITINQVRHNDEIENYDLVQH